MPCAYAYVGMLPVRPVYHLLQWCSVSILQWCLGKGLGTAVWEMFAFNARSLVDPCVSALLLEWFPHMSDDDESSFYAAAPPAHPLVAAPPPLAAPPPHHAWSPPFCCTSPALVPVSPTVPRSRAPALDHCGPQMFIKSHRIESGRVEAAW